MLDAEGDRNSRKNVETINEYVARENAGKNRQLHIRFLVSPTEVIGEDGKVSAITLVKNKLVEGDDGSLRPRATEETETIPVGLVFRSVGYRGKPLPNIPFNEDWGTILNEGGRVVDDSGAPVTGVYTAGWIKRGPSGVIGTNKTCAQETVNLMVEDLKAGRLFEPSDTDPAVVESLVASRQPDYISYADWKKIDAAELAAGEAAGRPRVKFTSIEAMLAAVRS